jgi:hypothetical protein
MTLPDSRHPPRNAKAERVSEPTHSEDGVDLTLIRWMLSLTPAERLEVLQETVRSLMRLRGEESSEA